MRQLSTLSTIRKSITFTSLAVSTVGIIGFLTWLFDGMTMLLSSINLSQLPSDTAAVISALLAIVGGLSALFALRK